ncbi:MAG TPA: hypothetical protein EYO73_08750, partial [Sulfurimonas sp.]|nr:hypothetical protein [Sulfurimonas sp.]
MSLPETLEHVLQFLVLIKLNVWDRIVEKVNHLKVSQHDVKIKPSSYNQIINADTPTHLAKSIINEHQKHADYNSDFHISGGVHDAINLTLTEIAKDIGGAVVSDWVGLEERTTLTNTHKLYARLAQQTYLKKRPKVEGVWARLDEFDTQNSCIWFDGKTCLLTVVGPETRYRKILEIKSVDSTVLTETLNQFRKNYPGLPVTVCTHSYGFEFFLNSIGSTPVTHLYSFNPARTKPQENPHKTTYLVNYNDVISDRNCKLLEGPLVFGGVLVNRVCAHTLTQWVWGGRGFTSTISAIH